MPSFFVCWCLAPPFALDRQEPYSSLQLDGGRSSLGNTSFQGLLHRYRATMRSTLAFKETKVCVCVAGGLPSLVLLFFSGWRSEQSTRSASFLSFQLNACDQSTVDYIEPLGSARQALLGNPDLPTMSASVNATVAALRALWPDPLPSWCVYQDGTPPPSGQYGAGSAGIVCELGVTAADMWTALNYVAQYDALARRSVYASYQDALHGLFLESYATAIDYTAYYAACSVSYCTYVAATSPTLATIGTIALALIGGLQSALHLITFGVYLVLKKRLLGISLFDYSDGAGRKRRVGGMHPGGSLPVPYDRAPLFDDRSIVPFFLFFLFPARLAAPGMDDATKVRDEAIRAELRKVAAAREAVAMHHLAGHRSADASVVDNGSYSYQPDSIGLGHHNMTQLREAAEEASLMLQAGGIEGLQLQLGSGGVMAGSSRGQRSINANASSLLHVGSSRGQRSLSVNVDRNGSLAGHGPITNGLAQGQGQGLTSRSASRGLDAHASR